MAELIGGWIIQFFSKKKKEGLLSLKIKGEERLLIRKTLEG